MDYVQWLTDLNWDDLPEPVKRQSLRCVKDIIATAAGSRCLAVYKTIREMVAAQYGSGRAPMWFTGTDSSLVGACYFNAQVVDSLDCHDGFRPNKGHCGATVVPVALSACALADDAIAGTELLTAVVIGYELASRAGLATHEIYAPHYFASGSWAAVGGAASGAKLLGIPNDQVDMTLGMAEYYAPQSPMLRCTTYPSVVKDAAGPGAWAAGMALAMARENLPGLPSLLTVQAEGKRQIATVGDDWMIMRQYFKPYPVCRWAQPVVEGIRALRSEVEFGWQEIESIEVETFANASGLMHWPPKHSDAAQYSLPWAVAIFVVDGELGIEQVSPSRLDDPRVLDVGSRIRTRIADDIEARFPEEALARTVVKLRSGRVLESPTLSARGDYTDPLSDDEMNEKAMRLLTAGLGNQHSHAVYEILDTLHQRPASSLIEALRREAMTC